MVRRILVMVGFCSVGELYTEGIYVRVDRLYNKEVNKDKDREITRTYGKLINK